MIAFPICKINLGLNILRKRPDGFHDLETIFYPLNLTDVLEIVIPSNQSTLEFNITGILLDTKDDNLCLKAYHILKKDFPHISNVRMHLHKNIPAGAGLGGGSADASFVLLLLNKIFKLELTHQQLSNYALQLGSDCPFFLLNEPCIARGRGEILEPIELDLKPYKVVLINPGIHISTADLFAKISAQLPEINISEIVHEPIENWKGRLVNDFEAPVFKEYPEIAVIKKTLYSSGALYASMTGTGSTVYGIFEKDNSLSFSFPEHYSVHELFDK